MGIAMCRTAQTLHLRSAWMLLVVVDRATETDLPVPAGLLCLRAVGLDRTVYERGVVVSRKEEMQALCARAASAHTRVFKPLMPQMRS